MEAEMNQKILFDEIRKKWDEHSQKWYFSIVDILKTTGKSSNPQSYWKVLKNRLKARNIKLVTQCNQLKLVASDGKFYLTDVADISTTTEILKIVSKNNILPFRTWALRLNDHKTEKYNQKSSKKFMCDMYIDSGKKSYPQVTYTLSKLILKKTKEKSQLVNKKDRTIKRMRTI